MNKVAFLLCSDTIGGHEFQSVELIKDAAKYCFVTVFLNNKSQLNLINGIDVNYIVADEPFFKQGNFLIQFFYGIINLFKLRRLNKEYDMAIVCAGTLEAGISSGLALWGGNTLLYIPTFVDRTWIFGAPGYLYNFLSMSFMVFYRHIITINRFQALFFSKVKNVIILPNKIQISCYEKKGVSEKRRLYFIGRLEKAKRLTELVRWLDCDENPFEELIIIGDGSEWDTVVALSNSLKRLKLHLHGWKSKEDQEAILTSSDIMVFNSLYEGDPLAIREANERGSIVIARDILGIRGCTLKKNRFNTQQQLYVLLQLAYNNKLDVCKNIPPEVIDRIRENASRKIFI